MTDPPLSVTYVLIRRFWAVIGPSLNDSNGTANYGLQHFESVSALRQRYSLNGARSFLYGPASDAAVCDLLGSFPGAEPVETKADMQKHFETHVPYNTLAGVYIEPNSPPRAPNSTDYAWTIMMDPSFLPVRAAHALLLQAEEHGDCLT
jgi:hypothetical protein